MPFNNKSYAKIALTTTILLSIILLAISCKECPSEPKPEPEYNICLSVEDVLCTLVTLKVTLPDSGKINSFSLDRNDSTIATYTCNDNDTLITDEGITPDTDFSYKVRFLKDGKIKSESEPVTVHTMPTTSHNFIWEVDTLGNYGSYLNDVWILDDNNIWAVGNIETDSGRYNISNWDGNQWSINRIGPEGNDLYSIFAFSENDIWITNSCSPYHWDGTTWTYYRFSSGGVGVNSCTGNAMWGSSSSNIYFVGNMGSIVHYNGSTFTKMESGTDIDLVDIWGIDQNNIWACGYTQSVATSILHYDGQNWNQFHSLPYSEYINLNSERISGPIVSIWTDSQDYLWAITYWGLYWINTKDSKIFKRYPDQNAWNGYIFNLDCNASNDMIFSGDNSAVWHFNGKELYYFSELPNNYALFGMAFKKDCVYFVGQDYSCDRALIVKGIR